MKYKGVTNHNVRIKSASGEIVIYPYFHARIQINGKKKGLGTFKCPVEAAIAYDKAAVQVNRKLNFKLIGT